jgi:hypothetical protein
MMATYLILRKRGETELEKLPSKKAVDIVPLNTAESSLRIVMTVMHRRLILQDFHLNYEVLLTQQPI